MVGLSRGENMTEKEEKTMIKVSKKTRKQLGKLQITPRESYDEIIRRILKLE